MCKLDAPCGGVVYDDVEAARRGEPYHQAIRMLRCLNGHRLA
jgi:hypothetical protein